MSLVLNGMPLSARVQDILNRNRTSLASTVAEKLDAVPYPGFSEPAIIHPIHKSVVKLRENGMIDVFVDKNTGIRIDPETASINFFADTGTEMYDYLKTYVSKDQTTNVKRAWTVDVGTRFNLKAGRTISMSAPNIELSGQSNINFSSPRINFSSTDLNLLSSRININGQVSCPGHHNVCPYKHSH